VVQQAFNFGAIGFGILTTDAFACDGARHLVQIKRHAKPLFAGHLAVVFDLFAQCRCRIHVFLINQFLTAYNFKSSSVTAPNEADVTWAAYLASTPRV
jgi:hypothetical protein